MVTRSNTRSKTSAELPVHVSNSKIFGRVDLLDQSGEVTQSWLIDSQSCQVGSSSSAKICIDHLAPVHASFVFGRRNTLVKCLQGSMTVGAKNVREYLIDEPTTIHLSGASLIVFPTAYVRNLTEQIVEEDRSTQQAAEPPASLNVPDSSTAVVESTIGSVSSEELHAAIVSSTVSAVQKSLEPLQSTLASLTGKWEQLLHSVKAPVPSIVVDIERRFEQIEQQIPQLSSELGEMNGRLSRSLDFTNSSMADMALEIRERFDFISQRFNEKADSREASIDSTLSLLAEQLKQIQERLEAAPDKIISDEDTQFEEELPQYRSEEQSDYNSSPAQNTYDQRYLSSPSYESDNYDNEYGRRGQEEFEDIYDSSAPEEAYTEDQGAEHRSGDEEYSQLAIDESASGTHVEAEYIQDYETQEDRNLSYTDYSYEYVEESDRAVDSKPDQDDPSDYQPADSDLLGQAQNSDYDPADYGYAFHSHVSEDQEELDDEDDEDIDYEVEDRTPTASYTPIDRSFSDAQNEVVEEYLHEEESVDYAESVSSKPGLPEWFTKVSDDSEQGSGQLDNELTDLSELESKLDSAVYQPLRGNDRFISEDSDALDDSVEDNRFSSEAMDDQSYGQTIDEYEAEIAPVSGDQLHSPIGYALPEEIEIEIDDDLPSAESIISHEVEELDGSEELADDEESVEQYMQRLLARVKGGDTVGVKSAPIKMNTAPAAPPTNKALESAMLAKSLMDSQDYAHRALSDEEYTPRSAAPESSLNLEAMRTLANETARTALAKSLHKPVKKQSHFGKLGISVFGFLIGTSILLVNGITMNVAFLGMICGYLIFLIWGFEATQNVGLTTKRH